MNDEVPVKRWTAKRKSALVIDIFKGKTTPVEVARKPDWIWCNTIGVAIVLKRDIATTRACSPNSSKTIIRKLSSAWITGPVPAHCNYPRTKYQVYFEYLRTYRNRRART
jgi:hypothetical protein